jgi:hypothetical protein
MLRIGFTGTSRGMTPAQLNGLRGILSFAMLTEPHTPELHQGDCIGSDARANEEANRLGWWTVGHPPTDDSKRAFTKVDSEWPAQEYMVRNHEIVDVCSVLIATPATGQEVQRSGTWATVRYARKIGTPLVIIWPSGEIEVERP